MCPTLANPEVLRRSQALARCTITCIYIWKDPWRNYVSSLNTQTKLKAYWKTLRSIQGKCYSPNTIVFKGQRPINYTTTWHDQWNRPSNILLFFPMPGFWYSSTTNFAGKQFHFDLHNTECYNDGVGWLVHLWNLIPLYSYVPDTRYTDCYPTVRLSPSARSPDKK